MVFTLLVTLSVFLFVGVHIFLFVNRHFLRQPKDLLKYGKWAVVTGSTDGIGKAVAQELAKKKMNLVLISRTLSKLNAQAAELKEKFGVETSVVAIDFGAEGRSKFDGYRSLIQDLDVGLLVNNVGQSYDHAEYFDQLKAGTSEQLIRLNIDGTIAMTEYTLPGMLQRNRGAIVNVSSASSLVSEPLYAVYSATKAFVNNYSVALHYEYKSRGIHVQVQLPAYVATKLSKIRSTSVLVASPESYAKSFIKQIGYEPLVLSYWSHDVQLSLARLVPQDWLAATLLSTGKSIRARALKKKETAGKQ
ncbi:hypothetical protein PROFUN_10507 [Planoprotostelium fungivorum]|uniref:Uncharacterized protein n=1 Tax=Planoprotostelium fungivorum TaxID=1890364 RepID=A0A2P6N3W9_9EUKA|nr:hypothetical protein PROFUN_13510 [Planoprotostelium fungivorum]PRP81935.1 hypothetical protein PROFUN_10507 [Planoprotostelium fungivorum]